MSVLRTVAPPAPFGSFAAPLMLVGGGALFYVTSHETFAATLRLDDGRPVYTSRPPYPPLPEGDDPPITVPYIRRVTFGPVQLMGAQGFASWVVTGGFLLDQELSIHAIGDRP